MPPLPGRPRIRRVIGPGGRIVRSRAGGPAATGPVGSYPGRGRNVPVPPVPGSAPEAPAPYVAPPAPAVPVGLAPYGTPSIVPTSFDIYLRGTPEYQRAAASRNRDRGTQMASLSQAIATALGRYGGQRVTGPAGLAGQGTATTTTADISAIRDSVVQALSQTEAGRALLGSLDWSQIQNMANQSTEGGVSTLAQLERQQNEAQRAIQNSALSRGIQRSGLAGYDEQQQNRAYTEARYGASQELMDYLSGLSTAFAQGEAERAGQFEGAIVGIAPPEGEGEGSQQGTVGGGEPTAPPPPADQASGPYSGDGDGRAEANARKRRANAAAAAARARARARARRAK